jgi:hypothetical protein
MVSLRVGCCYLRELAAMYSLRSYWQKGTRMSAIKILHDLKAAHDNVHTRTYEAGEVYEVDDVNEAGEILMPSWLADALCKGGHRYPDKHFKAPLTEGITHVPMKEAPAAITMERSKK